MVAEGVERSEGGRRGTGTRREVSYAFGVEMRREVRCTFEVNMRRIISRSCALVRIRRTVKQRINVVLHRSGCKNIKKPAKFVGSFWLRMFSSLEEEKS